MNLDQILRSPFLYWASMVAVTFLFWLCVRLVGEWVGWFKRENRKLYMALLGVGCLLGATLATADHFWGQPQFDTYGAGGAFVKFYEPSPSVRGGILTLQDHLGREKKIFVSADAELKTWHLNYPRDVFERRGPTRTFRIWYWDGQHIENGHLVIHHIS